MLHPGKRLREIAAEVEEKRRENQKGAGNEPVDRNVKSISTPGVAVHIKYESHRANQVKMKGTLCPEVAQKDEHSDQ